VPQPEDPASRPTGVRARAAIALFGYDFFISYRQKTAGPYVDTLVDALRDEGFVCFRDKQETTAGTPLTKGIEKGLRKSQFLAVILEPGVLDPGSTWVPIEVERFATRGADRTLPINVNGLLEGLDRHHPSFGRLKLLAWLNESETALSAAQPSPQVVDGLRLSHHKVTALAKLRALLMVVVVVVAGLGVAGVVAWRTAARNEAVAGVRKLAREATEGDVAKDLRLLLAGEALRRAELSGNSAAIEEAIHAFRKAALLVGGKPLFGGGGPDDPKVLAPGELEGANLSEDGRWLVASFAGARTKLLRLWDLGRKDGHFAYLEIDSGLAENIAEETLVLGTLAIDNRAALLAARSQFIGKTVWLWDVKGGSPRRPRDRLAYPSQARRFYDLTFSSDGRWLAGAGALMDLRSPDRNWVAVTDESLAKIAFSDDGRWMVHWRSTPREIGPPPFDFDEPANEAERKQREAEWVRYEAAKQKVAVSPIVWEQSIVDLSQSPLRPTEKTMDGAFSLEGFALSPDGCWLASWGWGVRLESLGCDGTLKGHVSWPLTDGRMVAGPNVDDIAFSADSREMAVALREGGLTVVPLRPLGAPVALFERIDEGDRARTTPANTALYSRDGRWLAVGGSEIRVWDNETSGRPSQPTHRLPFAVGQERATYLLFDPTGRWLLAGPVKFRLWDLRSSDPSEDPWQLLPSSEFNSSLAALTTAGDWLVTITDDARNRRPLAVAWPLTREALRTFGAAQANRNFTREEWSRRFGSAPWQATFDLHR
jgi:WD40 repeat protein